MSKLTEAEINEKLPAAKGWQRHGDMLVRTWQFPSFRRAIEFVNQIVPWSMKRDTTPTFMSAFATSGSRCRHTMWAG